MSIWVPLESNPDVMTNYIQNLGIKNCYFVDILGFDEELLQMIPRPVFAVILLFPIKESENVDIDYSNEQSDSSKPQPYFLYQTIRNACGSIALIHSIANNIDCICFTENSTFKEFYDKSINLKPIERAKLLEGTNDIGDVHEILAGEGQTAKPESSDTDFHFVAFIEYNNTIYELDGRKTSPIEHGNTNKHTFLEDTAAVCRKFMDKNPNNINFTAVALIGSI